MTVDISSLPEEVLINIFKFLNVRNRLTASLVCKKWLRAINCHKNLYDIKIYFSHNFLKYVQTSSHMTRQFLHFSFDNVMINDSVVEFLKQYSKQFVTLKFNDCKVVNDEKESKFQEKVLNCENLQFLNIHNSDVIPLFGSLPNVIALILHVSTGLTDYVMFELNKTLFKLEIFSLSGSVIYNERDYQRFYMNGETIENNPSKSVLSFVSIKKFIEKHCSTIRVVNLAMLQLSPDAVVTISEIKDLKLESVLFPSDLESSFMKKFCENQFSLTSLDLSISRHVTDDTVSALCKCLPNLERFFIRNNHAINISIIEIFQLEHLEALDLNSSDTISESSYRQAMLKLKAFKLKHLNLAFARIADDCLCELLKHNLNIRHLNISHTRVSNKTLNMISKNLILIENLDLSSCLRISDSGLTGEFENYSDSLTPTPLSNLKKLRKLDISDTNLITNDGCIKAMQFPKLLALVLHECDGLILKDDFVIDLEKQNPCLQHVFISSHSKKYVMLGEISSKLNSM
ncbi:f-box domain-containing protein [Trichonephila clavata]|uniref:F-box domain-containing protein n=1 Tax=Trichonephila clavata TaxID=2740835 RepID=A0A8X6HKQ1_TRICU|nr:f-box domain-containing protein [Trichonephila clavata]